MALQGLWGKLHLHGQLLKARFSEFRGARGGVKRHRLQENQMRVTPQFLLSLVGQKKGLTPMKSLAPAAEASCWEVSSPDM